MNDLRERANYDPEAHAPDERTQYDLPAAKRIDPRDLTTVPMSELRSPTARALDAEARDLCPDCRTFDQQVSAELAVMRDAIERIADAVTVLMSERDMAREREGRA